MNLAIFFFFVQLVIAGCAKQGQIQDFEIGEASSKDIA
jgi:hypothetical protein